MNTVTDWKPIAAELTQLLSGLIRIDTTNPPGNETAAAQFIATSLRQEGLAPEVLESGPGRGNVFCRIPAPGSDDLTLLSHLDVVGAGEGWEHDPFGGELIDGFVWGRGAIDCKGLTAMELMVTKLVVRLDWKLKRGLTFGATADEESGGKYGAGWLVDNRPDLITPYVINEGGGIELQIGDRRYYPCQTGEKGGLRLQLTVRGTGGHAARPTPSNPILLMGRVLTELAALELPVRITDTVRQFLAGIGVTADGPYPPGTEQDIRAMIKDTISPTILRAGERINVIPPEASLSIDARLLPGSDPRKLIEEIRARLASIPGVEIVEMNSAPGVEAPCESPLFDCIADAVANADPGATVVPYLSVGGTDAKHLSRLGARVYGFMPIRQDDTVPVEDLVHSTNERLSVANLVFGTRMLLDVVRRFCVS